MHSYNFGLILLLNHSLALFYPEYIDLFPFHINDYSLYEKYLKKSNSI